MKKVVWVLFAALLVVALPLSAMAGTQMFKAKDREVDLWETCAYISSTEPYPGYIVPVGPAYEFKQDVLIHYVGTEKFNARVKNGDVGWNRNVHGTAYIYPANGGGPVLMEVMSAAPKLTVKNAQGSVQSMYPYSCWPLMPWMIPNVSHVEPLYSGPFQVEEVVQDDGGDFGCFDPSNPAPVNFQDCFWSSGDKFNNIDYVMLHLKITGNKIYFFKQTIHEPGKIQMEDHRGYNETFDYWF